MSNRRVNKKMIIEEFLIILNTRHYDAQEVVPFARHGKALHNLVSACDKLTEQLIGFGSVIMQPYVAKNMDSEAKRLCIRKPDGGPKDTRCSPSAPMAQI